MGSISRLSVEVSLGFLGWMFAAALLPIYHDCSGRIPGHTTKAPQVGLELETNSFLFYANNVIVNLDKTSLFTNP